MFTNYFWQRETLFNSQFTVLKVFKLAQNQLRGFHSYSSDLTVCVSHNRPLR